MKEFTERMLKNNEEWVTKQLSEDANYFKDMALGQTPEMLWIGCADSRVPANEITGTHAGEMFVHRNIANMVIHTDFNIMSVLEYAVTHLKVRHVVVCGHYGCGGVGAAMSNTDYGIINKWVRNIKDVYRIHAEELNGIADDKKRLNRLVELNVIEQVKDLAETSIVQRAWKERGENNLFVHGWVYDLESGRIINLDTTFSSPDQIDKIYRFSKYD